jgi:hypothetical protein
VYQEIGWPFPFKGPLIGTCSYFDADAATQSKLSRVCTWFCQGVYKGVSKGVYKGVCKGVYNGVCKGVYKGVCKGVYKGVYKSVSKGVSGNRVAIPIQRSPNRN